MKVMDYNVVLAEVVDQLNEDFSDIQVAFGIECAPLLIANIYMMNNLTTGYGQDVRVEGMYDEKGKPMKASLISSTDLISIILPEGGSHWRADLPLCGYEDLHTDILNICVITQAVLDRIWSRQ